MLTTDLLRARIVKGRIQPAYLDTADPANLDLARQMIEIFHHHVERSRGELKAELRDFLGTGTAFLLHRGLAKLLEERCRFVAEAPIDPPRLRREVFEAAARAWGQADGPGAYRFPREEALTAVGDALQLSPRSLEASLYADLRDEEILRELAAVEPDWLLRRYNVALAQGVLLRATSLRIELAPQPPRVATALFRRIKFFQLLHRIEACPEGPPGTWRIELDGPLSLFKSSQRYGLRMASFLPTLLHLGGWRLEAEVSWGKKRLPRHFHLSADDALAPVGNLPGRWLPEELRRFPKDFASLESSWEISTRADPQPLGEQGVLIPDFTFRHRETGFRACMEVLGFWNQGSVGSRLDLLKRHGPPNLLLAVAKNLAAGQESGAALPAEVYIFRSFPLAKRVLRRLEEMAGARPCPPALDGDAVEGESREA